MWGLCLRSKWEYLHGIWRDVLQVPLVSWPEFPVEVAWCVRSKCSQDRGNVSSMYCSVYWIHQNSTEFEPYSSSGNPQAVVWHGWVKFVDIYPLQSILINNLVISYYVKWYPHHTPSFPIPFPSHVEHPLLYGPKYIIIPWLLDHGL